MAYIKHSFPDVDPDEYDHGDFGMVGWVVLILIYPYVTNLVIYEQLRYLTF